LLLFPHFRQFKVLVGTPVQIESLELVGYPKTPARIQRGGRPRHVSERGGFACKACVI